MKTPPLYILKLKSKGRDDWQYFNDHIISDDRRIGDMGLDFFIYTNEKDAKKTILNVIGQQREDIAAMKLVELSHYPPYPEHQVVWYKEFK